VSTTNIGGSASIAAPEYWWYRARADLLRTALGRFVGEAAQVLDVGSADGPSVGWLRATGRKTALDIDPRGLAPGGRLLLSVPAYQWAWSDFDEENGHHRRYTRHRLARAVQGAGLHVERTTYAFTSVFPFFAAERLLRRLRRRGPEAPADIVSLPEVSPPVERLLLGLARLDRALLGRRDLPFGSSVLLAASKAPA
jgi:hypothetical protein